MTPCCTLCGRTTFESRLVGEEQSGSPESLRIAEATTMQNEMVEMWSPALPTREMTRPSRAGRHKQLTPQQVVGTGATT